MVEAPKQGEAVQVDINKLVIEWAAARKDINDTPYERHRQEMWIRLKAAEEALEKYVADLPQ